VSCFKLCVKYGKELVQVKLLEKITSVINWSIHSGW